jgi:hypothetical protein
MPMEMKGFLHPESWDSPVNLCDASVYEKLNI